MAGHITESELLEALRQALENRAVQVRPEGAMRSEEIAEALDINVVRVRDMLRKQVSAGQVQRIKIPWTDLAGRDTYVIAYKWVGERDEPITEDTEGSQQEG